MDNTGHQSDKTPEKVEEALIINIIKMSTKVESPTGKPSPKAHSAQQLWQNSYPTSLLIWQGCYLSFTMVLWGWLIKQTVKDHLGPLPTLIGFIVAQFLVDFVSGLLHWGCDTWGKFETPIFGPTLIRSFRMHHVDPQDITLHGFMQTCASSAYPAPPLILLGVFTANGSFISQTYNWMVIFAIVLGILTNQFHKWAHLVHSKPHPVIRFLQSSGLVISHSKHTIHHQGNFDSDYCIINGWMNPILEKIKFWRRLEALITKITGAVPREDDKFWRDCKDQQQ